MNLYTLIFMLIPFLSLASVDHDYFHPAASAFIHGDTATASNKVARGLQRYPNEPKLMRLKKLLEQQQQEEQQPDSEEPSQNQQDPSQESDSSQQESDTNDQPEPSPETPSQSEENETSEEPSPTLHAEEMSPEEAQRLLDAMRQDEENKRSQLRPIMGTPFNVERDW
ncbi:MAG: hypothetical protein ACJZ85_03120 [Pontiellaceae bacterium]